MNRNSITFDQAAAYGFVFPQGRAWITPEDMPRLAQDAALVSSPNASVPVELLMYFDPQVIEVLTAPKMAREIFGEVKKGDWTTPQAKFRVMEMTGETAPYSDYSESGNAGTNYNWEPRDNYVFQTVIRYGDLEQAVTAEAKINLAADNQRAAANTIDVDSNRFYFNGVEGKQIYGLLNDPGLTDTISPLASGAGGSVLWTDKTTKQRYDDVLYLFQRLVTQTAGLVDKNSPLKLCMSPALAVLLGSATDFNVSVEDMLKKYFSNLSVVTAPQYDTTGGELMQLIATQVQGQQTGELGFSEKMRAGRLVPSLSSFSQKFTAGTYGAILRLPMAVAQMLGM